MPASLKSPLTSLYKINLIHKREDILTLQARFTKWLLTVGRFLVIAVEMGVIAAFVYRYQLDAQIADLNSEIQHKVDFLKAMQGQEQEIRQVQYQLLQVKQLKAANPRFTQAVRGVAQITPKNITVSSISFALSLDSAQQNVMTVTGTSPTTVELASFMQHFKGSGSFKQTTLNSLSYDKELSFTISIVPNPKEADGQ